MAKRFQESNGWTIAGGEFENGYEVKTVSLRNVVLDELGPSVEELTRFNQVLCSLGVWSLAFRA